MRYNKTIDKNNNSNSNNMHPYLQTKKLWRLLKSLTVLASLTKYIKGYKAI